MNLLSESSGKMYAWGDTVTFRHSSGQSFPVLLSSIKNTDFVGYICSSCGASTTLAEGNCGSCGNPFEALDLREAKELFPSVSVKEKNPDRVAYLLLHQAWICLQCSSYNVNYPRTGSPDGIACVNCGKHYEKKSDILLEDGDMVAEGGEDPVANFRNKVLAIIEERKPRAQPKFVGTQISNDRGFPTSGNQGIRDARMHSGNENRGMSRNKWAILTGALGVGLMYVVYYGFIEEIGTEIQISGHEWERVVRIEGYRGQTGSGWQKDITPSSFAEYRVTRTTMKEAPWTGRDVQIGTKPVTDYGNCLTTKKTCTSPKSTTSTGVTVTGPQTCTESCTKYGTKPEPIMKTVYEKRPYIEYSYMDWQEVDSHKTTGTDKTPYWHDTTRYAFDGRTLRQGALSENYKIGVVPEKGKVESLTVPFATWNKLSQGDSCPANATRWGGVVSKSISERINECISR